MADASGIAAVERFLDEKRVGYEVVEHRQAFTAAGEARAAGFRPADAAKTVVLYADGDFMLGVIPADEKLDLRKVRALLGGREDLRLATEEEMHASFDAFELGAVPPLGPMLPAPEIIDRRLLEHDRILCSGGDHRHSLVLDPNELMRVAEPRVGDICQD
jgi:Ala-tRNA(Pro) deacylase